MTWFRARTASQDWREKQGRLYHKLRRKPDAFGNVYEYFLGKFAIAEGPKGGEYFTPTSIVRLIVEIIEPFNGKILDPAWGSGGMFVQSARFVEEHRNGNAPGRLSIYGHERIDETLRLCQMNLAVHGPEGQSSQSNTYYEDRSRRPRSSTT